MNIDEAFAHTFNALLGKTGEKPKLEDFGPYLAEYALPLAGAKSAVSGKKVTLVSKDYCESAKFISQDEIKEKAFEPLNINEIKDIDSILEAIEGRVQYAGNKVLGNSAFFKNVDFCVDSFYVTNSSNIQESRHVDHSWMIRGGSEFIFGSGWMGESKQIMRSVAAYNITRCFESHFIVESSDCYFSYNCAACSNALFSFNQRGSRYVVGNLALPKDEYLKIRDKILEEVKEKLLKDKWFPSLFSIIQAAPGPLPKIKTKERKGEQNLGRVEKAFSSTARIIFGKELGSLSGLGHWLSRHVATVEPRPTPFGRTTYLSLQQCFFMKGIDESRFVTHEEALELGALSIDLQAGEEPDLEQLSKKAAKIAYYSPEIITGNCQNIIETPIAVNSTNIYRVMDSTLGKSSAISSLVIKSEFIFGSHRLVNSRFCINCYHSFDLANCFELDSCSHCRDSMFCHNSENLDNCMFCFNVKSKRYAIGNVEVGKDAYLAIKAKIMKQITQEIEGAGELKCDIYTIGCPRKKG